MKKSILTKYQKQTFCKEIEYCGEKCKMIVKISHDDECGNGHNTFTITADITTMRGRFLAGGCLHDEIIKHFPEFAPLILWHSVSTDGPLHYIGNTLYHAGDCDCYGRKSGEPSSFKNFVYFGDFPIGFDYKDKFIESVRQYTNKKDLSVVQIELVDSKTGCEYKERYTLSCFMCEWHDCPFDTEKQAREFITAVNNYQMRVESVPVEFSKGKIRDLDAARSSAKWPEATDTELMSDNLEQKLIERLPALMENFQKAVESLGFTY